MAGSSYSEIWERTQALVRAASDRVRAARALRETCRELRHDNADLRDFMRESAYAAHSRYERWVEERFEHMDLPSEPLA